MSRASSVRRAVRRPLFRLDSIGEGMAGRVHGCKYHLLQADGGNFALPLMGCRRVLDHGSLFISANCLVV